MASSQWQALHLLGFTLVPRLTKKKGFVYFLPTFLARCQRGVGGLGAGVPGEGAVFGHEDRDFARSAAWKTGD